MAIWKTVIVKLSIRHLEAEEEGQSDPKALSDELEEVLFDELKELGYDVGWVKIL